MKGPTDGRYQPWPEIIDRLRRHPARWELSLPDTTARTAENVRLRRARDLRVPDGRLECSLRNRYTSESGTERGDLWLRFIPGA